MEYACLFCIDDDLSLYWFSDKNSQHSQNIRANQDVFLVIYDSTAPEGTGEGVYVQATVQELNEKSDVLAALRVMDARVGKEKERNFANYTAGAVLRGYKATPQKVWMNDIEKDAAGQYVRDIRVEVPIQTLADSVGAF